MNSPYDQVPPQGQPYYPQGTPQGTPQGYGAPQGQPYFPQQGTPQDYGAPQQGYGAPAPGYGQTDFAPGTSPTFGAPARFRVSLTKVTSFVIMTQQRRTVYTGTLEQLETAARNAMIHNLTLGWWGIPVGLIWTPIALVRNANNMKQIRALAQGRQVS
ncbi:MAG TPA: hypothetical protein VGM14_03655 [Streptosporangiaceae bacterium]|jgi:hypothetical protein